MALMEVRPLLLDVKKNNNHTVYKFRDKWAQR